jgi:2-polyprenyl-6-methoxyphenol hydroxylase-like FAD-dependent oxidoreductase
MTSGDDANAPAVVIGGGIGGLAAARLLSRHYRRVVVLERDVRPDVAGAEDAFASWSRPGVPQFRHSHAFLARIRLVLLAHLPDALQRLRAAGVREITLAETVPPGMPFTARPDDEDVVLLACRRATFEWALRESARTVPGIALREGVHVHGLVAAGGNGGRPEVTGVRLADGEVVPAALVVDASGRRSRAPEWLAAIGAPEPSERSVDTGIFYYTRFYRLRRAQAPVGGTGLVAGDLGWVKLAIFPGDGDTFSITVGRNVEDASLKDLADPRVFERFLGAFPSVRPWRTNGASVPIDGPDTPVLVMGQLRNRRRRFVDAEGALAPGFVAIGDAAYHSNPIYGRGCVGALVQAALLGEAVGRHPGDPRAVARHLHRESEAELRPFWEAAASSDRRALGVEPTLALANPRATIVHMAEQAVGWFLERGMLPASRVDAKVFRALLRVFHMLEPPDKLLRDPELILRSLPVLARVLRGDAPGQQFAPVPRAAVLARMAAADAG